MQIYTTNKGEKQGPFTVYRVKEMIDAGDLSADDLGWHEGLDEWCPIKDIPAVASTLKSLEKKRPQPADSPSENQNNEQDARSSLPLPSSVPREKLPANLTRANKVHPFLRFLARLFDLMLLNILVWSIFDHPQIPPMPSGVDNLLDLLKRLDEIIPREEQIRIAMIQGGALFVWNFIEALLISSYGTTPGKLLFKIKVTRKSGELLPYSEAMGRSVLVWLIGIGLGISILQMMAMTFSLFYLLSKGETLWDRALNSKVTHQALGKQRIVLAIGAYLVLLSLQSFIAS